MAHVKPKNRRTWDVHGEVGYSIGTSMEHNRCFNVYIVKTRATRISDSVFFKHQYITNPQITPETLVMKAAAELTSALKGTVSQDAETADALAKVSKLFQKIAASKAERAKAKEQRNQHRTHPSSRRAVPIPRVDNEPPIRQAVTIPRVQATPTADDCRVVGGGSGLKIVECGTPSQRKNGTPSARPNYISQDDDEDQPRGYNTRSRTTSIMQEAMLSCIDITKPSYIVSQDLGILNYQEKTRVLPERQELSAQQMMSRSFPMTWLCEMANSVMGENGELLEYRHLIANPMTRATWTHSYGNELGRLAQGMPGRAKGTDTIFFIPRHMVPKERTRDVTYGLITCLIRPEKIDKPKRTRLVAGGDRVHHPLMQARQPPTYLP